MGNDDLKNALMRAQGVQGFMGGGMATHAMPDGTVMPGATHGQYQAMGMQEGGPAESISPELLERIDRFAGGASMKGQGIQEFMGGGMVTHADYYLQKKLALLLKTVKWLGRIKLISHKWEILHKQ